MVQVAETVRGAVQAETVQVVETVQVAGTVQVVETVQVAEMVQAAGMVGGSDGLVATPAIPLPSDAPIALPLSAATSATDASTAAPIDGASKLVTPEGSVALAYASSTLDAGPIAVLMAASDISAIADRPPLQGEGLQRIEHRGTGIRKDRVVESDQSKPLPAQSQAHQEQEQAEIHRENMERKRRLANVTAHTDTDVMGAVAEADREKKAEDSMAKRKAKLAELKAHNEDLARIRNTKAQTGVDVTCDNIGGAMGSSHSPVAKSTCATAQDGESSAMGQMQPGGPPHQLLDSAPDAMLPTVIDEGHDAHLIEPALPALANDAAPLASARSILRQLQAYDASVPDARTMPAAWRSVRELTLSMNQIQSLPESVGELSQLKKLRIAGNSLRALPGSIGRLGALELLEASKNQLGSLPESLGELRQLKKLIVWGNLLRALPESIGCLGALEVLEASKNQLGSLPESVGELRQLTTLSVSDNPLPASTMSKVSRLSSFLSAWSWVHQLRSADGHSAGPLDYALSSKDSLDLSGLGLRNLPHPVGELRQLKKLIIMENSLRALPESIGRLGALEELWAHTNQLESLPESIGGLRQLKKLLVGENSLRALPKSIGRLSALGELWAHTNQLESLPESVGELRQLKKLIIMENSLRALPESIGRLDALMELWAYKNQLETLPESVVELRQLKKLIVWGNLLRALPESIGCLGALEVLEASKNQLGSLPESVGELKQLKKLSIYENSLRALPESIGRLGALEVLEASKNQLESLPESVVELRQLRRLIIDENSLSTLPLWIGRLQSLRELTATMNRLTALPASVGQLSASLKILFVDNPLRSPPLSIVALGMPAIVRYFTAFKGEGAVVSRWAKLVLVGDGTAGKTSLLRALQRGMPAPTEADERTIQLDLSELALGEGDDLTMLSCWDLGGQPPYAAAQQPFVVTGVLYVLAVRADRANDAAYHAVLGRWLDVLQAGAPGAVVQPVLTHADWLGSVRLPRYRTKQFLTFGAPGAQSEGGKVRYEITLYQIGESPQVGWASGKFTVSRGSNVGVGDNADSWAIDGKRHKKWHNGSTPFDFTWSAGDVLGVAADFVNGTLHFARNGKWVVAFQDVKEAIGVGLFPAMSGRTMDCSVNLGECPFVHAGPDDEYEPLSTSRVEFSLLDGEATHFFECTSVIHSINGSAAEERTDWILSRIAQHRAALERRSTDPPPPLRIQEPIPAVSAVEGGEVTIKAARSRLEAIVLAQPPLLPSIGLSIPKAWMPVIAMARALRDGRHPVAAAFASQFDQAEVACGPSATYGAADAKQTDGKVYYEVTLFACGVAPRIGWAAPGFVSPSSTVALGDDGHGWAADGSRLFHDGHPHDVGQQWVDGDVIGVAADLEDYGELHLSRNGKWALSVGRLYLVHTQRGLFPAVGGNGLRCAVNLGASPFRYPPPDDSYVPVVAADAPKQAFRLVRGEGSSIDALRRQPYLSIAQLQSLWTECTAAMGIDAELVVEDILQLLTQQGEIFCSHGIAYLDPVRCYPTLSLSLSI